MLSMTLCAGISIDCCKSRAHAINFRCTSHFLRPNCDLTMPIEVTVKERPALKHRVFAHACHRDLTVASLDVVVHRKAKAFAVDHSIQGRDNQVGPFQFPFHSTNSSQGEREFRTGGDDRVFSLSLSVSWSPSVLFMATLRSMDQYTYPSRQSGNDRRSSWVQLLTWNSFDFGW